MALHSVMHSLPPLLLHWENFPPPAGQGGRPQHSPSALFAGQIAEVMIGRLQSRFSGHFVSRMPAHFTEKRPLQAPVPLTLTPNAAAVCALQYVTLSQPHTGLFAT